MNIRALRYLGVLPLALTLFSTLALCVFYGAQPFQAEQYVYQKTPLWYWLSLGTGTALSAVLALRKVVSTSFLLVCVLTTNASILLLPFLQGRFFFGGADAPTHVGSIYDISLTGHLTPGFLYPALHLMISSLEQVTGATLTSLSLTFWPIYLNILFVSGMYMLLKLFVSKRNERVDVLVVLLSASFPLQKAAFHYSLIPNGLVLNLLPLILVAFLNTQRGNRGTMSPLLASIVSLLFSVWVVVAHILAAGYYFLILLSRVAWQKLRVYAPGKTSIRTASLSSPMWLLLGVMIIFWFYNTAVFQSTVFRFWQALENELTNTGGLTLGSGLAKVGNIQGQIMFFLNTFGISAALIAVAAGIVVRSLVVRRTFSAESAQWVVLAFSLGVLLVIPADAAGGFRTINFAFRGMGYLVIFSLIIIVRHLNGLRALYIHLPFALALLIASWFTLYPSPRQLVIDDAVNLTDVTAVRFVRDKSTEDATLMQLTSEFWYRLFEFEYGLNNLRHVAPHLSKYNNWRAIADHFGGGADTGSSYDEDAVLLYRPATVTAYDSIWRSVRRYTTEDLKRLVHSHSVVYATGRCLTSVCAVRVSSSMVQ